MASGRASGMAGGTERPLVLFLGTGNASRSQMAEALLEHYAQDRFEVHSAGIQPTAIHPMTYRVMAERGLDLSGARAKGLDEFLGKVQVHYLILVFEWATGTVQPAWSRAAPMHRLVWALPDPESYAAGAEEKLQRFREIRDDLDGRIRQWLAEQGVKAA